MIQALRNWWRSLDVYADPRVRGMLFLGFSSGLPFPLVLTTLSARLRLSGIDRTTIGLFSLVGLAYLSFADLAPSAGLKVERTTPFRSMRVSPQQSGRHMLSEDLVIFSRP